MFQLKLFNTESWELKDIASLISDKWLKENDMKKTLKPICIQFQLNVITFKL